METASPSTEAKTNYLNADYGIKSWLLTTDHKRIAILYLISITVFFFLGGFFAMLVRLELLTPAGDLVLSDTYNKLFTMHGVVMIFLFLLPSIPAAGRGRSSRSEEHTSELQSRRDLVCRLLL